MTDGKIKVLEHPDGFLIVLPQKHRQRFLMRLSELSLNDSAQASLKERQTPSARNSRNAFSPTTETPKYSVADLARLFDQQTDGSWRYNARPSTVAGILPMIFLYWRLLNGESEVRAGALRLDLSNSGLADPRLDRVLKTLKDEIVQLGTTRGTRYCLTNEGLRRAEQVLIDILASSSGMGARA